MRSFIIFMVSLLLFQTSMAAESPTLYQAGTIIGLANGFYHGTTTFSDLLQKGNLGIGTVNGAEGEAVIIDKHAYAADINGNAHLVPTKMATAFAMIVDFKPGQQLALQQINNLQTLTQQLDQTLPSANIFYAMKIPVQHAYIKMRDWIKPAQPIPLNDWIQKHQQINEYSNIDGDLIIFKSPDYANQLTVANYHIHFISRDRSKVGHVFDVKFASAKAQIQAFRNFSVLLPNDAAFLKSRLSVVSPATVTKLESH